MRDGILHAQKSVERLLGVEKPIRYLPQGSVIEVLRAHGVNLHNSIETLLPSDSRRRAFSESDSLARFPRLAVKWKPVGIYAIA